MKTNFMYFATFLMAVALSTLSLKPVFAQKLYILAASDSTDNNQSCIFNADIATLTTFLGCYVGRNENSRVVLYEDENSRSYFGFGNNRKPTSNWFGPPVNNMYANESRVFDNMISAINKCPLGSKDTLFVYWSGHGYFDGDAHYLSTKSGKSLKRSDLIRKMKGTNARLCVLLTDACADERTTPKPFNKKFEVEVIPWLDDNPCPLVDELFFGYKGLVDINACVKGEKAYSYPYAIRFDGMDEPHQTGFGVFSQALFGDNCWAGFSISNQSLSRSTQQDNSDWLQHEKREGFPRGNKPLMGVLTTNYYQRMSWKDVAERLADSTQTIYRNSPSYNSTQPRQTIAVWSLPEKINHTLSAEQQPSQEVGASSISMDKLFMLQPGDVVLTVNGQRISGSSALTQAVKNSPDEMTFSIKDKRTGKVKHFMTTLNSSGHRFGVYSADNPGGGARITSVMENSAARRCFEIHK